MLSFSNAKPLLNPARRSECRRSLTELRTIARRAMRGSHRFTAELFSSANAIAVDRADKGAKSDSIMLDFALNKSTSSKEHASQSTGTILAMQASLRLLGGLTQEPQYRLGSARCFATVLAARCAAISSRARYRPALV